MRMKPLDAREWLESIVRTGAQQSGHADEALRLLDEAEETSDAETNAQGQLADVEEQLENMYGGGTIVERAERAMKVLDDLAELTGALDETLVPLLTERTDAWGDVRERMVALGYCSRDATTEDVLAAVWLFLPDPL